VKWEIDLDNLEKFRKTVLRVRTHFRLYRRYRVSSLCFALLGTFSAVPRVSVLDFIFCAPGPVFGGNEGVKSCFHVLHARTHFRRYWGRRVPFSCFERPNSFWAEPRVSGPIFMFCAPGHVFGGAVCVGSRFRRYRGRRVPFSCFVLSDSFSEVPSVTCPIFMFCVPRHVFSGTESVGPHFHVLRSRSRFLRYRGRRVPFSSFALPYSFSAVPRASGPVFKFARPDWFSAVPRESGPFFMLCAPGHVFDGAECVVSHFHVLCVWTRFRRSRGRHDESLAYLYQMDPEWKLSPRDRCEPGQWNKQFNVWMELWDDLSISGGKSL
jgi:hypothetical protein